MSAHPVSTSDAATTLPNRQVLSWWPTTVGVFQCPDANDLNPTLARACAAHRALQRASSNEDSAPAFFASRDDLLTRFQLPEWRRLVQFIVDAVRETAVQANADAWSRPGSPAPALAIAIEGIWFQFSNRGAHHDVHTHGNCSWSGVYCIQVDDEARREADEVLGHLNGVTRFYGPYFNRLGGAHMDFGSAYLQVPHADVPPRPGQLIVFPAWLPHQALPYRGEQDRLIVSFNASIHAGDGQAPRHAYANR